MTELVERWQGGDVSDPEAVEALKSIEKEVLKVGEEAGEQAAERAEYAIYTHLTEECPDAFESDEKAKFVAEDLLNTFTERVDRDYSGWEINSSTEQEIEELILDVFAIKYDRPDLIDDALVDAIRGYLITNYV